MGGEAGCESKGNGVIHLRKIATGAALVALLVTGCAGGETDPVAACEKEAEPVWEKVLSAQTMAELEALPELKDLPACRGLDADQNAEVLRRNSETGDKIVAHVVRVALTEGEN